MGDVRRYKFDISGAIGKRRHKDDQYHDKLHEAAWFVKGDLFPPARPVLQEKESNRDMEEDGAVEEHAHAREVPNRSRQSVDHQTEGRRQYNEAVLLAVSEISDNENAENQSAHAFDLLGKQRGRIPPVCGAFEQDSPIVEVGPQ